MLIYTTIEREDWFLTEEGQEIASVGSHEVKVFNAIPAGTEGLLIADLQVCPLLHVIRNHITHLLLHIRN
jgi:hypothetical protein